MHNLQQCSCRYCSNCLCLYFKSFLSAGTSRRFNCANRKGERWMEGNGSSLANRPTLLKLASYSTALYSCNCEHNESRISNGLEIISFIKNIAKIEEALRFYLTDNFPHWSASLTNLFLGKETFWTLVLYFKSSNDLVSLHVCMFYNESSRRGAYNDVTPSRPNKSGAQLRKPLKRYIL